MFTFLLHVDIMKLVLCDFHFRDAQRNFKLFLSKMCALIVLLLQGMTRQNCVHEGRGMINEMVIHLVCTHEGKWVSTP